MPILKRANVLRVIHAGAGRSQIAMALRARLIFCRPQTYSTAMLHMAFRASDFRALACIRVRAGIRVCAGSVVGALVHTARVMWRPVVARQAGRISCSRRESPGLPHVAGRALFFQNRVSVTQAPAGVHAMVMDKKVNTDPHQRNRRNHNGEPQPRILERSRPFEIVQVNPLSDGFSCARSRH